MYVKTGIYEVGIALGVAIRLQGRSRFDAVGWLIWRDTERVFIGPQPGKAGVS